MDCPVTMTPACECIHCFWIEICSMCLLFCFVLAFLVNLNLLQQFPECPHLLNLPLPPEVFIAAPTTRRLRSAPFPVSLAWSLPSTTSLKFLPLPPRTLSQLHPRPLPSSPAHLHTHHSRFSHNSTLTWGGTNLPNVSSSKLSLPYRQTSHAHLPSHHLPSWLPVRWH